MMSSTEGTHDILNYVNMRNQIMENDGRLHSLRHRLNGPYVCPKCNSCFLTSQLFASHAVARHYKYETAAQRAQRRRTRYERSQNIRNRRLVTVVSERRSGSQRRNKPELPVVAEGQGQSTQLKREAKDQPN
ncbi:C2H2-like zinc finger protein [Quillaja saponaria]|uniref:C2H2-like zinc finger protein n=1 Tax=Quillaja saponaria TaxID=32244 RepID=A0AAD7PJS8_QUISA|nr:C2H2-like zinc finger protein [Quillaja saponaria]